MVALGNKDYKYETDLYDATGKPAEEGTSFVFLVRAQEQIDTAGIAGTQTADPISIRFHLNLFENKGKYGLHPRYVVIAREIDGGNVGSPCLVQKGRIPRQLVILNLDRFDEIIERDETSTPVVEGTQITLEGVLWRVIKKVPERRDNNPNPV